MTTLEQLQVTVSHTLARVHAALDQPDERMLDDARSSIERTIARLKQLEHAAGFDRAQVNLLREHILRLGGLLRTLQRLK